MFVMLGGPRLEDELVEYALRQLRASLKNAFAKPGLCRQRERGTMNRRFIPKISQFEGWTPVDVGVFCASISEKF